MSNKYMVGIYFDITMRKAIMALLQITSLSKLKSSFKNNTRNYALLYKPGSETSDCSYNSISKIVEDGIDINVVAVNVNEVRDIHLEYKVATVPTLLVFNGDKFENSVKGCNDKNYYKSLFESAMFSARNTAENYNQKKVTVYSTPTCSWCTTLKLHLKKNGIRYTEVDVSKDLAAAEAMKRRSGQQGVPQTDINGEMIVGFDKNKINGLLNIK
jgi:glutaredoxin-like YruB-family protein